MSTQQNVEIEVQGRYIPSRIEVPAGTALRLTFVRRDTSRCTREVVFPQLGIRRELPTDTPVEIELPADLAAGSYDFTCGMKMVRGQLILRDA